MKTKRNENSKKRSNQRDNEKEETANPFSGTNQLATPSSLQSQLLLQTKTHLYRLRSAIYPL
jgi:hypothetical protein